MSTEPWDTGDLDELEELKRDRGYVLVVDRIESMIEKTRADLENDSFDYPKICTARGYLKALRDVLSLPVILRGEKKAKERQHETRSNNH